RRHTSFSRDWSSDVCSSDLFARLWEKRDNVDAAKVKSYLFTTVHRLIIDDFRKGQNRQKYSSQTEIAQVSGNAYSDLQEILHEADRKSVVEGKCGTHVGRRI